MIAASQRRVTRDGLKKQMETSNLNRSGRPSTEVVFYCEPCVWISGTAWIPGAWPIVGRAVGRTSFTIHPGSCQSLSHHSTPPTALHGGFRLLESCLEQSRRHVYRGAACVAYAYQGGLAIARFCGAKSSPFSAMAYPIRRKPIANTSDGPLRHKNLAGSTGPGFRSVRRPTDSART